MARHRWNTTSIPRIKVYSDDDAFSDIRKSPGMVAYLEKLGSDWESRLNTELKAAQTKRKQPVEDGYEHHITVTGDRARLYMVAATARAQAHEASHSSILKLMETSGHTVDRTGKDFKNPTKGWIINDRKAQAAVFLQHVRAFTNV